MWFPKKKKSLNVDKSDVFGLNMYFFNVTKYIFFSC